METVIRPIYNIHTGRLAMSDARPGAPLVLTEAGAGVGAVTIKADTIA
jgi:hypothetical protein